MRLLIGIDDTDNKETRGTGFRARQLAGLITENKIGHVNGITRHQLYVHPDIPYTSHNSSACIDVVSTKEEELRVLSAHFLQNEAAPGSDAGLCIAAWDHIPGEIEEWGKRAKYEILSLNEALEISARTGVYLEGFTGTFIGQIGALAAVGLRRHGNDGRFIWLGRSLELRDFETGIYSAEELKLKTGIDLIQDTEGFDVPDKDRINCEGWTRPVLLENFSVLLVEKTNFVEHEWKTLTKDYIRSIT
jgi:hypothetical protein